MHVLSQHAAQLGFLRDNSVSSLLQPLAPFAVSVAAVPATEAICERILKAGEQVLTSARQSLMGSRVEAVLMTNFNSQLADTAQKQGRPLARASGIEL